MCKRHLAAILALSASLVASAPAAAAGPHGPLPQNENSPHNMGYCARYLGGGGLGVRPTINKLLATSGELFGYANPGELYSVRARDAEDRACLPR
jgi:hypothetical protein